MRRVVWSDDALRDFEEALAHIAGDNPAGASLVADRIDEAVLRLAGTPVGIPAASQAPMRSGCCARPISSPMPYRITP